MRETHGSSELRRRGREAALKEARQEVARQPWLRSLLPEWLQLFTSSPKDLSQASNPFLGYGQALGGPRILQKFSKKCKAKIPARAPAAPVPAMIQASAPASTAMVPASVLAPAAMFPCSSAGPHSHGTVLQYHPTQPWFRVPVPCPAAMVPAQVPVPAAIVPAPVPAPAAMCPLEFPLKSSLKSLLESPLESPLKSPLDSPLKSLLKSLLKPSSSPFPSPFFSPFSSPFSSPLSSPLSSPISSPNSSPLSSSLSSPLSSSLSTCLSVTRGPPPVHFNINPTTNPVAPLPRPRLHPPASSLTTAPGRFAVAMEIPSPAP
ncbi:hypothetical protein F7725_010009 [Dissostichus mawsoni]|uniref:Uncharacterized protein n=1 Tax=Dissostichus mawsoni TaxID=36200 RepID=A0A7J5XMQ4_DISMA|nr:hypothetical protein F7725_010009 [Dissostichus mawsoni]